MSVGPFQVYNSGFLGLVAGDIGPISESPFTAVLLKETYTPSAAVHKVFADIAAFEVGGQDYSPKALSGMRAVADGSGVSITSQPLSFGSAVTIPKSRYFVIVAAAPGEITASSRLIGFADLRQEGGSVEAVGGEFTVQPSPMGWFRVEKGGV